MIRVLEKELSKQLQAAIDKGEIETFQSLMTQHQIDGHSMLHATSRANCFPLINRVCQDFTNKNYLNKIKIADIIMKAGGKPIPGSPYGFSALASVLHDHSFLRLTSAKFEVYQMTILFAHELVVNRGADVNFRKNSNDPLLSEVIREFQFYEEKGATEMMHVTYKLAEAMLERGAIIEKYYLDKTDGSVIGALLTQYQNNAHFYQPPKQTLPFFDELLDETFAREAKEHWEKEDEKGKALRALALIQERVYLHSNCGFGQPELDAWNYLNDAFGRLGNKPVLSDLKKLNIPKMDAHKRKSDYEKMIFERDGGIHPRKPCFDDALYSRLYGFILKQF